MAKEGRNFDSKSGSTTSKGGKRSRGSKRATRDRSQSGRKEEEYATSTYKDDKGNPNDPSWYIADEQLLKDVASISYAAATGAWYDMGYNTVPGIEGNCAVIPGIMSMKIYPGPGKSHGKSDAVNIAANMIYSRIRSVVSGTRPYDAPDLMMYILGADHAYMYLSWMQRLYGMMNVYSSMNRYMPNDLVSANGVNPNNLRANMARFRTYINQYALQLSVLYVPADIPLFSRHYWLYQNLWTDADSAKAQFYMYVPYGFGVYEETASAKGGVIRCVSLESLSEADLTVDDIITFGNRILNNLIMSEDIATISGDVRKTYGEGNSLSASTIDEVYSVIPTMNKEILSQIENLTVYGLDPKSLDVVQDPNTNIITWETKFAANNVKDAINDHINAGLVYLSSHGDATSPADNLVMTRLHALYSYHGAVGDEQAYYDIDSCGSEIVMQVEVHFHAKDANHAVDPVKVSTVVLFGQPNATVPINMLNSVSKFDWHPLMYTYVYTNNQSLYSGVNADLDEYAIVPSDVIKGLNDIAILGELGVPYRTFK